MPIVLKCGSLKLLEPSGPVQTCNGIALPFTADSESAHLGFEPLLGLILDINLVVLVNIGDRGSTVAKVLCYKSEGCWLDPSWCKWIFH